MIEIINFLISNLFLAILVGFFSSLFFYLFLFCLKPNIFISDKIAKGKDDQYGGKTYYRIKVVNLTKYPVIDINAQLHIVKSFFVDGKEIFNTKEIKLVRQNPLAIGRYDKKDKKADYAYRFVTNEDILQLLERDDVKFLRFRMICKHAFSNFGAFFQRDFYIGSIKEGDFEKGYSFEIKVRDSVNSALPTTRTGSE